MEKVKWGVLGTANIAKGCTIPGMQQVDTCELYAIAGRDINKALKFKDDFGFQKAYGSYEELIEDSEVQAIYIPLPNGLHLKFNQSGELSYQIYLDKEIIERKISVPQNYSLEIAQLNSCILNGETQHITPDFSIKNAELMDEVFRKIGYYN